jgi:Beta-lactamase superfamily domain
MAASDETNHRRPLLHHLNADSSWLLQLPVPSAFQRPHCRTYFNILVDPWLQGYQSDVSYWFSNQTHAIHSAYQTIQEVSDLAWKLEPHSQAECAIDVVAISHEFTDHCHRDTLLEVPASVPVYAPDKAAALIRSWSHFATVNEPQNFGTGQGSGKTNASVYSALPSWVAIMRLVDPQNALYYHSAVVILFHASALPLHNSKRCDGSEAEDSESLVSGAEENDDGQANNAVECVLYTPHGIAPSAVAAIENTTSPRIRTLCLLHGMHDVVLSPVQQLNLGGHNALQVQRILKPTYWVATHDEVKKGGGLVSYFLRRKVVNLQDALQHEKSGSEAQVTDIEVDGAQIHFAEVGNGEYILLE